MVLTRTGTLESYFDPRLNEALHEQGVHADGDVRHYLVSLLAGRATAPTTEASLVELELQARSCERGQRCRALRQVGDHALFTTGMFGERLRRRGISQRYYCDKGSSAYAEAAEMAARTQAAYARPLRVLARRFGDFVCVLRHLRGATALSEPRDAHALLSRMPALRAGFWGGAGGGLTH